MNQDQSLSYKAFSFEELELARKRVKKTQREVAEIMGTKAPAVSRLENYGKSNQHVPSIQTLSKYAKAVGCKLQIRLIDHV
jgi:transcriptional regulator with XRE-family HTH domain